MNTGVRATGSLRRAVRVSSPAFRTERAMIAYVSCLCPVHESVSCWSIANNIELDNQKCFIYQRQWRTITNDGEFEMPPSHGENRGSSPLGSANEINKLRYKTRRLSKIWLINQ